MKTGNVKMLCIISFLAVHAAAIIPASAQQEKANERREKIYAMKVAYLTQRLGLTSGESEKFWPVYKEYQDKKTGIMQTYKEGNKVLKSGSVEQLTDEQAEKIVAGELEKEQKLLDLKTDYTARFKKIIGVKRVVLMQIAEKEFNKLLLDKLKEKRKEKTNKTE